jgi:LEA14-like dessication related protein
MKQSLLAIICLLSVILTGCGTGNGLTSAYNVTKCEYKYNSISNLNLSGMNLSKGVSPLQVPKVIAALSGASSSVPLDFTLNLNVKNPNATVAALNGLEYIINIDDIQFTTGKVNQAMTIAAGETQNLPLNIGVDIATLMKGQSKTAVQNIVKNFVGVGSEKSNVTVQIKPTFMMGSMPITSPFYIPVSFSFGGK